MPRVLCLYPSASFRRTLARQRPALRKARVRLVLATLVPRPGDADLFDEGLELPPGEDVEGAVKALAAAAEAARFDGLLALSPESLPSASLLARELGLPALPVEAALLSSSRHLARMRFEAAGIPQPRFALAASADDAHRFAASAGWPITLSTLASSRPLGDEIVHSPEELEVSVQRVLTRARGSSDVARLASFARAAGLAMLHDPRERLLVESHEPGIVLEAAGLCVGHHPRSLGVLEHVHVPAPQDAIEGYLHPAARPAADVAAAERVAASALAALGVRSSAYSVTLSVHGGRAGVLTAQGCLPDAPGLAELFRHATGPSPLELLLDLALGGAPELKLRERSHAAVAYRAADVEATVTRVPDESVLAASSENDVAVALDVEEGEHAEAGAVLAHALAAHPTSSRVAHEKARDAVRALRFELEPRG